MRALWRTSRLPAAALLIVAAGVNACSRDEATVPIVPPVEPPEDTTPVRAPFDLAVLAQQLAGITTAVDRQSGAWLGLKLVGEALASAGATPNASAADGAGAAALPLELRGKTFAWDAASNAYVEDPQSGGAPPDGVRFTYYSANGAGTAYLAPLAPRGFIELRDVSEPPAVTLAVRVVQTVPAHTTLAEYSTRRRVSSVLLWDAAGSVQNPGRVEFALDEHRTGSQIQLEYAFNRDSTALFIRLVSNINGNGSLRIALARGPNLFDLSADGTDFWAALTGTVTYNDTLRFHSSGSISDPVYTAPGGGSPTQQQRQALRQFENAWHDMLNVGLELLLPVRHVY